MKKPCEHYTATTLGQEINGPFIVTHFQCDKCGYLFGRYVRKP